MQKHCSMSSEVINVLLLLFQIMGSPLPFIYLNALDFRALPIVSPSIFSQSKSVSLSLAIIPLHIFRALVFKFCPVKLEKQPIFVDIKNISWQPIFFLAFIRYIFYHFRGSPLSTKQNSRNPHAGNYRI